MSDFPEDKPDRIPTYEESVASDPPAKARPSLAEQLARTRASRIESILHEHIDPLLLHAAVSGIHTSTTVLVPSNSSSLQPQSSSSPFSSSSIDSPDVIEGSGSSVANAREEAIVSFPDDDYVKLVRLHGDAYALEFWRQPAVIAELDVALRRRLEEAGHDVWRAPLPPPPQPATTPSSARSPGPDGGPRSSGGGGGGKWRWGKKQTADAMATLQLAPEPEVRSSNKLGPGQIRMRVELQDICMRVLTDMGLYDTKTGKAVVIHMEIGA